MGGQVRYVNTGSQPCHLVYFAKIFEKSHPKWWNNSAAGVFATYCCAYHSSAHGPSSASRISTTLKYQMINCAKSKRKHKVKCLDQHSFWTFVRGQGTIYHYCILWTCIFARPFPQHQLMMKLQRLLVSITETDFDLKRLPYDWTGGKHKDVWLYAQHTATN